MEYTIARVAFSKEVTGRTGIQHNIRFTTNETGEKSISGFFSKPLNPGDKIDGEIVEKPGINKDGQPVIYHNFHFARKNPAPSMNLDALMIKLDKIYTETYAARQEIVMVRQLLQKSGVLPVAEAPQPVEDTRTAFDDYDEGFAPEDIAFG